LAPLLADDPSNQVVAIGEDKNIRNRPRLHPRIQWIGYPAPRGASPETHHYLRNFENGIRRGQTIVRILLDLKSKGFYPDIICVHPGWGEGLFLKDLYPNSRAIGFFEFYYHAHGSDVGFDPEYPSSTDDLFRVRIKNAVNLFSLEACDTGISPTHWQRDQHPKDLRHKIRVVHDGIDTQLLTPNPAAELQLAEGLRLTPQDEVITYVARNLEPYRGFHSFMRALPKVLEQRPEAQVVIVGGDEVSYGASLPAGQTYREKLLAEVGDQIDLRRVHFLGRVPYTTFCTLLQISTVHIYLTYPFVLSWSMLEAMSSGCLVIGSATAPVQEVIEHERNGLLVDFFDLSGIAERICEALTEREQWAPLRAEARRTVIERYDLQSICLPQLREVLREME
jgi:glycosyltransferase involved in cell wall biosynthesis